MKEGRLVLPASPIALPEGIREMIDNPLRVAKPGEVASEKVKKEFFGYELYFWFLA